MIIYIFTILFGNYNIFGGYLITVNDFRFRITRYFKFYLHYIFSILTKDT